VELGKVVEDWLAAAALGSADGFEDDEGVAPDEGTPGAAAILAYE
jgi:hypothetical protein